MVWLVGRAGMVGREMERQLGEARYPYVATDRAVDITDRSILGRFLANLPRPPSWIVNCAAYTDVDRAETEPERAFAVNGTAVGNLAAAARSAGARLLHLSTDYVFDGDQEEPYGEDDPTGAIGVYGRSKAEGESRALETCPDSIVIRTSWLFGLGRCFVAAVLDRLRKGLETRVVRDQWGTPTHTGDLAALLLRIVRAPVVLPGVYHYAGRGRASRFELAAALRDEAVALGQAPSESRVVAVTSAEYPTPARRPVSTALATEKISRELGVTPPPWREALRRFLAGSGSGRGL